MLDLPILNVWGGALLGARADQQDTFLTQGLDEGDGLLVIVADGMGGHASGALASQTAAASFRDAFLDLHREGGALADVFNGAVLAANGAIEHMQAGRPERRGMGTTLVAISMTPVGLSWISVGDSALLLCRENTVHRLNEDHSLRALPEFAGSKQGNMLRSALNGDEIAMIDCQAEPLALLDGDIVLLASDGLLTLEDDEIAAEVFSQDIARPDELGPRLLRAVEGKGDPRQDNCTVVVVAIPVDPHRPPVNRPSDPVVPGVQRETADAAVLDMAAPSSTKLVAALLILGVVLIGAALLALFR